MKFCLQERQEYHSIKPVLNDFETVHEGKIHNSLQCKITCSKLDACESKKCSIKTILKVKAV